MEVGKPKYVNRNVWRREVSALRDWSLRGLPFSTYAPRGGGWGQASYTFPLRITCKKEVGGSR